MGHANVDTTLNVYTQVLDWSSQDLVDTLPAGFVSCFELLWAEPSEMAVTSGSIVEGIDVVSGVGARIET
jgi:hypothetical protein